MTEGTRINYVRTWWQNAIIAVEAVTAVLTVLFLGLYFIGKRKKNV